MGLRFLGTNRSTVDLSPVWAAIEAAEAKADDAKATGQNARQMVLNRDPKLNQAAEDATAAKTEAVTLAELAATLSAAIPAAEATHAAINARIDALAGRKAAIGARPVTALALGGSVTITVPLSRPLAAGYEVGCAHSAVVNLANVTFTETARTTNSVTIRVQSSGLALAAGTLVVLAMEA